MPLYEYRCDTCGDVFEVIQKFSDDPLVTHPGCGGRVERLLSAPALQFKGTGWYVTDYAHKNGSSGSSGNGRAEAKAGSDSKPEVKADKGSKDSTPAAASSSKK